MFFFTRIIQALGAKIHWHANEFLTRRPALLNFFGASLTVVDVFGTPGDTLLAAIVCREVKKHYPRLMLNCSTPNPSLLERDPNIHTLNAPPGYFSVRFWYLDLIRQKNATINVLKPTMDKLGIANYEYRSRVYLTEAELAAAGKLLGSLPRPVVTINAMSRESVKVWPTDHWRALIQRLSGLGSLVQIGDDREPAFDGVLRLAGKLSMRESMAVLAHASVHVGPDSFLMHAANGLDIPSVIIYGGSRPVASLGYAENENLFSTLECSPCWLHDSHGDRCHYDVKCMPMITPKMVDEAVRRQLLSGARRLPRPCV